MKPKFLYVVVAILLAFSSCADTENPNLPDQLQVGVLLKAQTNSFRTALGYYAVDALEKKGITYVMYIAQNAGQQAHQIEMAALSGCHVIIVVPEGINERALTPAITANVPIILFEDNAQSEEYSALVKGDNVGAGENAAHYMFSKGVKNPVVFDVEQDPASSNARVEGFETQMHALMGSEETIVHQTLRTYTREAGYNAAEALLSQGSKWIIDAFYAQDDEIAMGVLDAIKDSGRTDIKVVIGCGGSQEMMDRILTTTYTDVATTLYSPSMITKCVDIAGEILKGNMPTPRQVVVPATIINKDNATEYLNSDSPY